MLLKENLLFSWNIGRTTDEANFGYKEKIIGRNSFDNGPLIESKHKSETGTLRRKIRPNNLSSKNILLLETKHESETAILRRKLRPKKISSKNLFYKPMYNIKKSAQAHFENRLLEYQADSG